MIDEKRLEEIDEVMEKNNIVLSQLLGEEDERELIQLAKLGLWARDVGVPAMNKFKVEFIDKYLPSEDWYPETLVIPEALSKLPKDNTK